MFRNGYELRDVTVGACRRAGFAPLLAVEGVLGTLEVADLHLRSARSQQPLLLLTQREPAADLGRVVGVEHSAACRPDLDAHDRVAEDPTDHNLHSLSKAGNDFNRTQLVNGKPFDVTLKAAELLRITCDNHTWMTAYVGIMENPYYAVSGADGSFTIANVPVGKQSVKAWHEVMGMQTQMVDVQAGKTTTVDFTFAPGQKTASVPIHELVVPMQMATR